MNDSLQCCVCSKELRPAEALYLGSRPFCADHYRSAQQRKQQPQWSRTGIIEAALVGLFVLGVWMMAGRSASAGAPTSIATGIVLALVPCLLMLVYVYRRDMLEPEPWPIVLGVFVLGGLLGYAVVPALIEDVFRVDTWQHRSDTAGLIASIWLVGTLQQLCIYLAVRYTVYPTDEFDEPVDGIVYASAAALGLAAVLNVDFIIRNDGVLPLAGAVWVSSTALIHVAAAAVLGYGLAQARFSKRGGQWILAAAFAVSIVVNGGLKHLGIVAGIDGMTFHPWASMSVVMGLAAVVLIGTGWLTARFVRIAEC